MENVTHVKLAGTGNLYGTIDAASWERGDAVPLRVRLDDGRELFARRDAFVRGVDGNYELSLGATDLDGLTAALGAGGAGAADARVVPVIGEQVVVGTRVVETGRVRLTKTVREREEIVDQPTAREEVVVERVPVEQFIDAAPASRQEGDVLIIPVVEEVLVVERRLMLKEEVRVTRRRVESREPQTVKLRTEEVTVERLPAATSAAAAAENRADSPVA